MTFLHAFSPFGNHYATGPSSESWGVISESNMYIGLLILFVALWGLFYGKHSLRNIWLFVGGLFALYILGPLGPIHKFLFLTFPPAKFDRHPYAYYLFFIFPLLFFYILGANILFSKNYYFKVIKTLKKSFLDIFSFYFSFYHHVFCLLLHFKSCFLSF